MQLILSSGMHHATIDPMASGLHPDTISVPETVRFPVELEPPPGFVTQQQVVAASVAGVLESWTFEQPAFFVGANEAGMKLGDDTRGAEGAVWRRDVLDVNAKKYARVPPILAVEVAGQDEGEQDLREKAAWYLSHGSRSSG